MDVFIARNGSLHGQWIDEYVHALYRAGILLPTDHYWVDGMPAWRTLASADESSTTPKEPVPVPQESLKQTTRLVPEDGPRDPSSSHEVIPEVANLDATEAKAISKPPLLPATKTPAPIQPAPYVYSEPARKILQLLAPGGTAEGRKFTSQKKVDFSKVEWLVPPGRTMPFGVAPSPSSDSSAESFKPSAIKPPSLTKGESAATQTPVASAAVAKKNDGTSQATSRWAISSSALRSWIIPVAAALFLFVPIGFFLGPATAHRLKSHFDLTLAVAIMAFAISYALKSKARIGARCLALGLATLVFIASHRNDASLDEQALVQIQALKSGQTLLDPGAADAEAAKLQESAQNETGLQRKLTDTSIELLHRLSERLKACQEAERPLLDLGFEPSKLISLKALDARCAAVIASKPSVQDMLDFLKNLDASARTLLEAKNVGHRDADAYVSEMNYSGKRPELIAYWQQESDVLADILANLDLLKTNWGKWRIADDGTLTFDNPVSLREYHSYETKLQAALALQKSAQEDAVNP